LSHVFLSRDTRMDNLPADSLALAEKLRSEDIPPEQANEWGDPFLLSHHIPLSSESSIGRQYGPQFAARALELPVGSWSDPIPSSYGSHIVWVHERSPSELPALGEIRKRVENERTTPKPCAREQKSSCPPCPAPSQPRSILPERLHRIQARAVTTREKGRSQG
jgi:hypothetical protein